MKLLGYWRESPEDQTYCAPQELIGTWDERLRSKVAAYLCYGEVFAEYRGDSWCRFGCRCAMGNREFSDGTYVWPEGLAHYVLEHGVILPEEFVRHIERGEPQMAAELWDRSQVDLGFWITWCQAQAQGVDLSLV